MNDSYLITMNNLAITSVSEISENVISFQISFVKSYLVVTQVMTVPVSATCQHKPYNGVTPTANLAKKIIEIPTLQFWLETSRFWQIFLASRFRSIFSRFLKLLLSLFNQSF